MLLAAMLLGCCAQQAAPSGCSAWLCASVTACPGGKLYRFLFRFSLEKFKLIRRVSPLGLLELRLYKGQGMVKAL